MVRLPSRPVAWHFSRGTPPRHLARAHLSLRSCPPVEHSGSTVVEAVPSAVVEAVPSAVEAAPRPPLSVPGRRRLLPPSRPPLRSSAAPAVEASRPPLPPLALTPAVEAAPRESTRERVAASRATGPWPGGPSRRGHGQAPLAARRPAERRGHGPAGPAGQAGVAIGRSPSRRGHGRAGGVEEPRRSARSKAGKMREKEYMSVCVEGRVK